jgi:hypothetical protein
MKADPSLLDERSFETLAREHPEAVGELGHDYRPIEQLAAAIRRCHETLHRPLRIRKDPT